MNQRRRYKAKRRRRTFARCMRLRAAASAVRRAIAGGPGWVWRAKPFVDVLYREGMLLRDAGPSFSFYEP